MILPWVVVKFLASKILALNIKRISDDWMEVYYFPLYLLETFVQQNRFKGTCYQASSWIRVGEIKGTLKKGQKHLKHDKIKDVYVYPLHKHFKKLLMDNIPSKGTFSHFKARPDGFDADRQRVTFCCMKQCLKLKAPGIRNLDKTYDISSCEHLNKTCGYTTHSSIDQHPRLLNEIPRGTRRYNDIKRCMSASERSNSTIKETLNILEKPSF